MILVTGATGHVGRAVVCRLASLGHDVVAMVRDVQAARRRLPSGITTRVADYDYASALKRALAVLISSDGDASAVMRHHANAIEAATATNIRHITFTSIVDTEALSPRTIDKYLTWASTRLDDPWPYAFSTLCASITEGRYSQVSNDFTAITGQEPESFRDFLIRATSGSPADCIAGSSFRERHRS
jgi:nucleoside-diphosphate-sugar epimerase